LHRFRGRPSPAIVISLIALFVALGGTGYAAIKLPKNSVGSKQIKKNAVTAAKVKKNAVTGAKVKDDSLTGADVLEAALAKVPSAASADSAASATKAGSADKAATADTATNVAAGENWHEVGTAGEPAFGTGCSNYETSLTPGGPNVVNTLAFAKDKLGYVHLKGVFTCDNTASGTVFNLPAGYRPAAGKLGVFYPGCLSGCDETDSPGGDTSSDESTQLLILGSSFGDIAPGLEENGLVLNNSGPDTIITLDGLTYKAES
jgi:hypothetical protein